MKFNTIQEATREWVSRFDAIPQSLIEKAYGNDITEITPPGLYDRVYIYDEEKEGKVVHKTEDDTLIVETDDGKRLEVDVDDMEVLRDNCLPMWGIMWMFDDGVDIYWLEELGGLQAMADCGFRVYEIEEGYVFGIDGAGYDFYEAHWIPLYKARGLKWHDEKATA